MTDINANKQRLDEITKEIDEAKRRLQQLEDDKSDMILQELVRHVDILCVQFQITLPQAIELLEKEYLDRSPLHDSINE